MCYVYKSKHIEYFASSYLAFRILFRMNGNYIFSKGVCVCVWGLWGLACMQMMSSPITNTNPILTSFMSRCILLVIRCMWWLSVLRVKCTPAHVDGAWQWRYVFVFLFINMPAMVLWWMCQLNVPFYLHFYEKYSDVSCDDTTNEIECHHRSFICAK